MLYYVNSMPPLRREIMIIFRMFLQVRYLLNLLFPLDNWKTLLNVVECILPNWLEIKDMLVMLDRKTKIVRSVSGGIVREMQCLFVILSLISTPYKAEIQFVSLYE